MYTSGPLQVPNFQQQYLEGFTSRDDLLDATLASAHIPFLLNRSPVAGARGGWFVDGALRDFLQCALSPPDYRYRFVPSVFGKESFRQQLMSSVVVTTIAARRCQP